MKLICTLFALALMAASPLLFAHTPLFDCFDNGDDTLTCEGGFSDGASATGVGVRMVDAQGNSHSFKPAYDAIQWEHNKHAKELFAAWCEGRTGYPLVDAAMAQINQDRKSVV